MAKFFPPLEELRARFDYDPETGLFTHQGKPRGYIYKSGYVMLRWGRANKLRANRVAWYLQLGKIQRTLSSTRMETARIIHLKICV